MSEATIIKWSALTSDEKDRFVAEKVMGWQPRPCTDEDMTLYDAGDMSCRNCGVFEHINSFEHGDPLPPRYTQSIEQALKIVETGRYSWVRLDYQENGGWDCWLRPRGGCLTRIIRPTAAEALCLAALYATDEVEMQP